mmetsp:Transcript_101824/g.233146  ORF Transcript_101824/g.233146 Transcript_101824/m.233146 type:complete len:654 (-) Transcript_101824:76-2037(-)
MARYQPVFTVPPRAAGHGPRRGYAGLAAAPGQGLSRTMHVLPSAMAGVGLITPPAPRVQAPPRRSGEDPRTRVTRSVSSPVGPAEVDGQLPPTMPPRLQREWMYCEGDTWHLGRGAFSTVAKIRHRSTRQECAVKILSKSEFESRGIALQLEREVHLMAQADHPNILKLHIVAEYDDNLFLVIDNAVRGDLHRYYMSRPQRRLPEHEGALYLLQACKGLHYLHTEVGMLHRDVKPDNILMWPNGAIQLADFGWSAEVCSRGGRRSLCGTFTFMAPEVLEGEAQTDRVDVWSTGVVAFQTLVGNGFLDTYLGPGATGLSSNDCNAATDRKRELLLMDIRRTCPLNDREKPAYLTQSCWSFVRALLNIDPRQRSSLVEAMHHEWIKLNTPFIARALPSAVENIPTMQLLPPTSPSTVSTRLGGQDQTPARTPSPRREAKDPTPIASRPLPEVNDAYSPPKVRTGRCSAPAGEIRAMDFSLVEDTEQFAASIHVDVENIDLASAPAGDRPRVVTRPPRTRPGGEPALVRSTHFRALSPVAAENRGASSAKMPTQRKSTRMPREPLTVCNGLQNAPRIGSPRFNVCTPGNVTPTQKTRIVLTPGMMAQQDLSRTWSRSGYRVAVPPVTRSAAMPGYYGSTAELSRSSRRVCAVSCVV